MRACVVVLLFAFIAFSYAQPEINFFNCTGCSLGSLSFPNSTIMYMQTQMPSALYVSFDEGENWEEEFNENVVQVYVANHNANWVIVKTSTPFRFWQATDGVSFSALTLPYVDVASTIVMSPHNDGTMLLYNRNATHYSGDFGNTWSLLPFGGSVLSDYEGGNVPFLAFSRDRNPADPVIVYAIINNATAVGNYGYLTINGGTISNFQILLTGISYFSLGHEFMWASSISTEELYASDRSVDPTHTDATSYVQAQFEWTTVPQEQPYGYRILDDSFGAGYIGAIMDNTQTTSGVLLQSEWFGTQWVTSLEHISRNGNQYEFAKVGGLNGVYIANTVVNYQQPSNPQTNTMITFDNGGEWSYLQQPKFDSNGQPYAGCRNEHNTCHLNLGGVRYYQSTFGTNNPFVTANDALGLLISIGDVAPYLNFNAIDMRTFITSDGGRKWRELAPFPSFAAIGNQGGVIVWAMAGQPTNVIYYSFDEGHTNKTFTLFNQYYIQSINNQQYGTGLKFVFSAEDAGGDNYIFTLDFTLVQPRICTALDYFIWSPSDGQHTDGSRCVNGETDTYLRRNFTAGCYNVNVTTFHTINRTACECGWMDYECDYAFAPSLRADDGSFNCTIMDGYPAPEDPPRFCPPGNAYTVTYGYRLVSGNRCVGGLNKMGPTKTCPSPTTSPTTSGSSGSSTGTNGKPHGGNSGKVAGAVIGVLLAVAVVGGVAFFFYKKPEYREKVTGLFKRNQYSSLP